jgi:hypothetical protein
VAGIPVPGFCCAGPGKFPGKFSQSLFENFLDAEKIFEKN